MSEQQQGEAVDFEVYVESKDGDIKTVVKVAGVKVTVKVVGDEGQENIDFVLGALPTIISQAWTQVIDKDAQDA